MGKRRVENIHKIENMCHRKVSHHYFGHLIPYLSSLLTWVCKLKVTYCKRKKGLLKKSMELSILCDLQMFVFIYDQSQRRVIHYASDPNLDFCHIFNEPNQREFYSNKDVSISVVFQMQKV